MRTLPLVLIAALALGCAGVKLGPLDPKPKIKVDPQGARLALSLGADVPDRFTVEAQGGVRKVKVKGWHETLTRGFENGLAAIYDLVPPDAEHDLLLVIVRTDLQFLPMPGVGTEGTTAAKARMTYQAKVLSAAGDVLAVSTGEVTSRRVWRAAGEEADVTAEVVGGMYKDVVFDLVTKTSPTKDETPAEDVAE